MVPAEPGTGAPEQRQLAMLEAISRSLSGALTLPEAILEITESARSLIEFERFAVLRIEREGLLRVHAAVDSATWNEGRLIRRDQCSERLWVDPAVTDRIIDAARELDPSRPVDRDVIERGTRSLLRVPLLGRDGPIGLLVFSHPEPDAFDGADERTAGAIAGLLALALEHERLHQSAIRRQTRLAAIEAILPHIEQIHDLDAILQTITQLTQPIVPHEGLAIAILHDAGVHGRGLLPNGRFITLEVPPAFFELQLRTVMPRGHMRIRDIDVLDESASRLRLHLEEGRERTHMDIQVTPDALQLRSVHGIRSQIRVGIRRGEEHVGQLIFNSTRPDSFVEDDVLLVKRLAERLSLKLAQETIAGESRRAAESAARALALEARVAELQKAIEAARGPHAVVGRSKEWQEVLGQATRVAGTDTTVLLTGESGTGKEVVARFLHHASPRAGGPFVAINCAALPENLLEAELFGFEKGAFTGATAMRVGRMEQAAGGVLFLDEVGEMSPTVQAKFLRVLQEREFQRLGGSRVLKTDARIIAATNRDLRSAIGTGDFREDLYYRLHVFAIHLPPLRERPADVLALTEHFLAELGPTLGRGSTGLTTEARDAITAYAWPGNARELRNVIERALILCDGALIHPEHLSIPVATLADGGRPTPAAAPDPLGDGPLPDGGIDLEAIERSLVRRAMKQADGNKSRAARLLGLTRAQLYSRIEKYGL